MTLLVQKEGYAPRVREGEPEGLNEGVEVGNGVVLEPEQTVLAEESLVVHRLEKTESKKRRQTLSVGPVEAAEARQRQF